MTYVTNIHIFFLAIYYNFIYVVRLTYKLSMHFLGI